MQPRERLRTSVQSIQSKDTNSPNYYGNIVNNKLTPNKHHDINVNSRFEDVINIYAKPEQADDANLVVSAGRFLQNLR